MAQRGMRSLQDRYTALLQSAKEELLKQAVEQAELNENLRKSQSRLEGLVNPNSSLAALAGSDSIGSLLAEDLDIRQRRAGGAGGTLRILSEVPKGGIAKISEGAKPARQLGTPASNYETKILTPDEIDSLLSTKRALASDTSPSAKSQYRSLLDFMRRNISLQGLV